jgi:GTP-binding protein LepA
MTSRIRNFSIIAHIDHGKSTLADRLLERTGAISEREMKEQLLDTMELERERGITIKAQAVRILYPAADGETYELNLIDTPGHVDFSYEVARSLDAVEGALLVVDATQGVEAQTLANTYLAIEAGLEIIPVVNKIDLPAAEPDRVAEEVASIIGGTAEEVVRISAKTGAGIEELLEAIVDRMPSPTGEARDPLRALIFDSYFDPYRGVVCYIRVKDGTLGKGDPVRFMATGLNEHADEVGILTPEALQVASLGPGESGYLITGVKNIDLVRVGDTVTRSDRPAETALPGYREPKPMVFSGLFPVDGDDFERLRDALDKLRLNDAALSYEPETSAALGFGFRCGFLGLLHMEIVRERLEREYDLDLVSTAPSVAYMASTVSGEVVEVRSPLDLPAPNRLSGIEEPYVKVMILAPSDYVGTVMELAQQRRGIIGELNYLSPERVEIDYEPVGYRSAELVKVDILLNGQPVDAFSTITHKDKAYDYGSAMTKRLRELIPRQLFDIPIQAAIGSRIIARETVKAKRKDVTAKCYGGDISRKRKLLERQREGKKRMKMVGSVEVPNEAFIDAIRIERE